MDYQKQEWRDLPNQTTPLSAARLNHLETQYDRAKEQIIFETDNVLSESKTYTDSETSRVLNEGREYTDLVFAQWGSAETPTMHPRLVSSFTRPGAVVVMAGSSTTANGRYPKSFFNRLTTQFVSGWVGNLSESQSVVEGFGVNCINAGVGSTTSENYLSGGRSESINQLNPSVVIHGIGTNDWHGGRSPEQFALDLEDSISSLTSNTPLTHVVVHQHEITTVVNSPYGWDDFRDAAASVVNNDPSSRIFVDLSRPMRKLGVGVGLSNEFGLLSSDGVHLTEHGDWVLGNLLAENLRVSGHLKSGWINIPLSNGYSWDTAGDEPGYRVVGDKLYLRGRVTRSGDVPSTYQACTEEGVIPNIPGVRGASARSVPGRGPNSESLVRILPNGRVEVASGMDNVVFLTSEYLIG